MLSLKGSNTPKFMIHIAQGLHRLIRLLNWQSELQPYCQKNTDKSVLLSPRG
ncbi:hypothetical protein Goshw_024668 [Gossypium schwendimanii]|uniref:Uncharacterized protein n=1 Tax=Gossypium schwendimanii TaxID=34291 RepID=A0A7J9LXY0_GOSSC|nr:hypothetical protein [Gossypium schwendimanii]